MKKFNVGLDSYTIGFKEKKYDESDWAKKVVFCNFKNKIHILDSDIIELWNKVTWHNDQPHGLFHLYLLLFYLNFQKIIN